MLLWIIISFAVLQGILEWLPVSSEGQTVTLLTGFLGVSPEEALEISLWLHLGTLIAVIVKYRMEIYYYINPKIKEETIKQWRWFILLSTIGTIITGVPCYFLVRHLGSDPRVGEYFMLVIGVALLITAVLLYYAKKQDREGKMIENISKRQMTFSGLLQGFSIIPGISRSGITMSGLLFMSVEKEDSIKGSFIMSIPAVLGGFVLNLIVVLIEGGNIFPLLWWQMIIAIIVTAIIGYFTMELFLLIARRYNFAVVCLFLGIITLLFFFLRWIG